jgi:NAD(P)-dependent dehydrogenase (short-subunit alcohol dehydrogenase family)
VNRPAVLVTGASKGIGEACTQRLVRDGFHVFAGVRRDEDADALRRAVGHHVRPIILDVTNAEHIADAVLIIDEETGDRGLQAVVNNAGVAIAGPLEFLPLDELRHQMEVNFTGQIAVTQAVLPLLRRSRAVAQDGAPAGRIVFMSSIAGRSSLPFVGAYAASKFALEAAADALRVELMPFGMDVVLVEPGVVATPIWDTASDAGDRNIERMPPQASEYYGRMLDALRRRVKEGMKGLPPERVADVVSHALTSKRPRPRYLVGRDAIGRMWLGRLLPTRVQDRLVSRVLRHMAR